MKFRQGSGGFTLIELMMVLAVIAIILSMALPAYQDYIVRAKVTEGLSLSASLKTYMSETCQTDPTASFGSVSNMGMVISSKYTEWVDATDFLTCQHPLVGFKTTNTGANIEPMIYLLGSMQSGRMSWSCHLVEGNPNHVPSTCRAPFVMPPIT